MQGVDLEGSNLCGADLEKAKLQGALLGGTQLLLARLMEAQLQGANLRVVQMQGANLFKADFSGVGQYEIGKYPVKWMGPEEAQWWDKNIWTDHRQRPRSLGLQPTLKQSLEEFKQTISGRAQSKSCFGGVIFSGGLTEKAVGEIIRSMPESVSEEKRDEMKKELEKHIDNGFNQELPRGAIEGRYSKEDAAKWIAEYKKAIGVEEKNQEAPNNS